MGVVSGVALSNQIPWQQVVTVGFQLQDLMMISVPQAFQGCRKPSEDQTLQCLCCVFMGFHLKLGRETLRFPSLMPLFQLKPAGFGLPSCDIV